MPWTDWQFWLVTLAMVQNLRVVGRTLRPRSSAGTDTKAPACAGCERCPEPNSESDRPLVVIGD